MLQSALAKPRDHSALRLLPEVPGSESRFARKILHLCALAIAIGYGFFLLSFFAPALGRPGIDENAYVMAGRNILEHGSAGYRPADDFQFVGGMWVRTEDRVVPPPSWVPTFLRASLTAHTEAGWYYAKYPSGVGFLNAVVMWANGGAHSLVAAERALMLAPVCTALAVLGMFYLGRAVTGSSFLSIMGMIVLACGQTTLDFSIIAGSHGPALCFVVWGMLFLLRWWQTGRTMSGILAGLLLGYAVTLRYTEALLLFPLYPLTQVLADTSLSTSHPWVWKLLSALHVLPIGPLGIAAISMLRWRRLSSYLRVALPLIAWAIPVGALVAFNWFTLGCATGYDTTHESSAFTTAEFLEKWRFTLHEVTLFGAFLIAPLGLVGLGVMFRQSWRLGWLVGMWFFPGALLYVAYYWGQDVPGTAYLRFYLTLFPPLILGALWLISSAARGASARRGSLAAPLAIGAVVAVTASVSLGNSIPDLERQHRGNLNLATSAENLSRYAKFDGHPMVIADEGIFPQFTQYGQFVLGGDWYCVDAFEPRQGGGFGVFGVMQGKKDDPNAPLLFQKARMEHADAIRKGKSLKDLAAELHRLIGQALDANRPVYVLLNPAQDPLFKSRYITGKYELTKLAKWREPCDPFKGGEASGPLTPQTMTGEPIIRWQAQTLTLYRLERLPPATRPSTQPAATTQPHPAK